MADTETAPAAAPRAIHMQRENFSFTGTVREYFGIWIVNVLLTIVTLGIYRPGRKSAASAISTATPISPAPPSTITLGRSRS